MSNGSNTQAGDVGEADTDVSIVSGETSVRVLSAADEPAQVRIGGQPGVRVQHSGNVVHKRVTGLEASADHRQVPVAVLAEVRALTDATDGKPLTAAERLTQVYELLSPWL